MIIGLTGTLGAGKGTIVEYLSKNMGFRHFSVRDYLTDEIIRRGLPVNRDNMVMVANELRMKHGPSHIIEKIYEQAATGNSNCIIESIRTPGEVSALRSKGNFILLAVDADREIRYRRIRKRGSVTDKVSYDTFIRNEEREMHSDHPGKQNLSECIRQADHLIINNGDRAELNEKIREFINSLQTNKINS